MTARKRTTLTTDGGKPLVAGSPKANRSARKARLQEIFRARKARLQEILNQLDGDNVKFGVRVEKGSKWTILPGMSRNPRKAARTVIELQDIGIRAVLVAERVSVEYVNVDDIDMVMGLVDYHDSNLT